jgi:DNA replication protein DnaC
MLADEIYQRLQGVKLFGMAAQCDELLAHGERPLPLSALDRDDFLEQKRNLLLIGGTGTGKTHPAIALGRNAARRGKRVSFYSVVALVNQLEQEEGSRSAF